MAMLDPHRGDLAAPIQGVRNGWVAAAEVDRRLREQTPSVAADGEDVGQQHERDDDERHGRPPPPTHAPPGPA